MLRGTFWNEQIISSPEVIQVLPELPTLTSQTPYTAASTTNSSLPLVRLRIFLLPTALWLLIVSFFPYQQPSTVFIPSRILHARA